MSQAIDPDMVSVVIAGQQFTGWESVRISRSCEKVPPDFDLIATERNPDTGALALLPPGAPCQVTIGGDLVLTGFVDRYIRSINPRDHKIQIQGRGTCEDIVDSDITGESLKGMQITTSSLKDLATKLCAKFANSVKSLTGNDVPLTAAIGPSGQALVFNANLQQTVYEVIEEVARYAGVLVYEDTDGTLLLANVGASTMASGFAQGVNVQAASGTFTLDERFRDYLPVLMSVNMYGDQGIGGTSFPVVHDYGVPRFRQKFVVSEQQQFAVQFASTRAQWEMARRLGRSSILRVTCSSWRDKNGTLWAPNSFAPIDIAALSLAALPEPWVIASIDFIRSAERGTVADLTLMPKEGLTPEPIILMPFPFDPNAGQGTQPPAGGGAQPAGNTPAAGPTVPIPPGGGGALPGSG